MHCIVPMKNGSRAFSSRSSDRRVLDRGLTVSMHCIKSSEKMFDRVLSKCVCCIVRSDSCGIVGV